MCSGTIGNTQACTKIMWVSDAIQNKQKRRAFDRVQQFINVSSQGKFASLGNDTLMPASPGHAVKALTVRMDNPYLGALCSF